MIASDAIKRFGAGKSGDQLKALKRACTCFGISVPDLRSNIPDIYLDFVKRAYNLIKDRSPGKWKEILDAECPAHPSVLEGYSLYGDVDNILFAFRDYIHDRRVVEINAMSAHIGDWVSGVAYDYQATTESPVLKSAPKYQHTELDYRDAVAIQQIPFFHDDFSRYNAVFDNIISNTEEGILVCPVSFLVGSDFDVIRNRFFAKFEVDFAKYCDYSIIYVPHLHLCPVVLHYARRHKMSRKNHMDILYVNYYNEPHVNSVVLEKKFNWMLGGKTIQKYLKTGNPYGLRVLSEEDIQFGWHDVRMRSGNFRHIETVQVSAETRELLERSRFCVKLQDTRVEKHGKVFVSKCGCLCSDPTIDDGGVSIVFPGPVPENDLKNLAYALNVSLMNLRGCFDGMLMLQPNHGNSRRISLDILFGMMTYYMKRNKWRFVEVPE